MPSTGLQKENIRNDFVVRFDHLIFMWENKALLKEDKRRLLSEPQSASMPPASCFDVLHTSLPVRVQSRRRNKHPFSSGRTWASAPADDLVPQMRVMRKDLWRISAGFMHASKLWFDFQISSPCLLFPRAHTHTHTRTVPFMKMRSGGQGWFLQQQCIIMAGPPRPQGFSLKSRVIILIFFLHSQAFEGFCSFIFLTILIYVTPWLLSVANAEEANQPNDAVAVK